VTAILGRNDYGKSSLFTIAFGNLKPRYMLIGSDNKPLLKPLYKTGLIKYLPQYNFIPEGMKLFSVFKLFDTDWKLFIAHVDAFIDYKNTKFKVLFVGERHLVETYIILKTERQMVILDEPFSYLSPLHIETIKLSIDI
jgi:ABC-type uncharacterized transport system ATPase subunit